MAEDTPPDSSNKDEPQPADESRKDAPKKQPTLPPAPVGRTAGKKTTAFSDLILGGAKQPAKTVATSGTKPSVGGSDTKSSASGSAGASGSKGAVGSGLGLKLGSSATMKRPDVSDSSHDTETSATDLSLTEMEVLELDDDEQEKAPAARTSGPPQRNPPPRPQRTPAFGRSAADTTATTATTSGAPAATAERDGDEERLARAAGLIPEPSEKEPHGATNPKSSTATYPSPHWAGEVHEQTSGDEATCRVLHLTSGATRERGALDGFKTSTGDAHARLGEGHCELLAASIDNGTLHLATRGHGLPSLRETMRETPVALDRACGILRQVAAAGATLEKEGIEHGALTVDAVLLDTNDVVRLTDVGLVKLVDLEADAFDNEFAPHLPETAVGMPPERPDIYGFGCVAFFALTGRPLFREAGTADAGQQRRRHAIEEPDRLKREGRKLHEELNAFVQRCLEKDPSDRYEDFTKLGIALGEALTAAGVTTDFDDLGIHAGGRTVDSREVPTTAGAIVARASSSSSNLAPVEQSTMRVAGASVIAPIADAADAASPRPATPLVPAPSSDEKGLEEFELQKAHIDWPTKSRRLRQIATVGAAAIFIVLALRSLGEYMSERAAQRDAEDQATLARGDLPDRWKDPNASASTTGTLEVVFAEGTPPNARDATTIGGDTSAADTSTTGDGGDTTTGDGDGDDTTTGDGDDTTTGQAVQEAVQEAVPLADEAPPAEPAPAAPTPAPAPAPTGDPDKLAKQASSALKSGNRNKAISLYKQALAVNSRHVTSLIGLSDIYFDSGSYSAAARYLRRLTSVRPSTGEYRVLLGDAYYKSGAFAKAVTQYERAVSLGVSGADRRLAKAQSKL